MIKSKEEYYYYLEADRIALSKPKASSFGLKENIKYFFFPDYIWEFQKTLRKLEYLANKKRNLIESVNHFFVLRRFYKQSLKLGFTIPLNVFGPGLSIAHYGTIIINSGAKVGANCRIHADVNIGTDVGYHDKAPVFGDNIYIGPGAKIFGNITIASNIAIGANAVVNKSFDEQHIAIGGIPAKKIADNIDLDDIMIRATNIIDLGLNKRELAGITSKEIKELLKSEKK